MTKIVVTKQGFDAATSPVSDELIDSTYNTILVSKARSGSITIPSGVDITTLNIGESLDFVPLVYFFTDKPYPGTLAVPNGSYVYCPLRNNFIALGLVIPTTLPGLWTFGYQQFGFVRTAKYFYIVSYLPSQGSIPSSGSPLLGSSYINISNQGDNVFTDPPQKLSFSTLTQTVQIVSDKTFNINWTDTGSNQYFAFPHGLSSACPFSGSVYDNAASVFSNISTAFDTNTGGTFYEYSIDDTNFYFGIISSGVGNIHNLTLHIHFLLLQN